MTSRGGESRKTEAGLTDRPGANLVQSRYEYAAETIHRYAPSLPVKRVFDIGAGEGQMRQSVERENLSWHGFDIAPLQSAIQLWNICAPRPASERPKAGIVLLLDVIEHLTDPGVALRNISDAVEPGGILILTAPNPRWSRSRLHALFFGNPSCFTQLDLEGNGHVFTPWPHIMVKMLHDADFAVEEYVTLDGRTNWPRLLSLNLPVRIAHAATNKLIEYFDASACGMSFGMVARRKAE